MLHTQQKNREKKMVVEKKRAYDCWQTGVTPLFIQSRNNSVPLWWAVPSSRVSISFGLSQLGMKEIKTAKTYVYIWQ